MTKIQISKLKVLDFEIGILNLFVICDLLFGIWNFCAKHILAKRGGFPIRKSPDQRLLGTSPKHIVATPRPSSLFLV